ncbi:MAG: glycosyltransferase [Candidatus Hydrogenedentes bacterium]|nr:glycosyltransferase [Candidatus Hydrogenedentota bacterium]
MRLLHVYKDFYPPVSGGMERHIGLMCRFQRQWAEVRALVCSRGPRTRRVVRDGTEVIEVGEFGRLQSAPLAPAFPLWLRRLEADVIVVHMPNPTAEAACLLAHPRAKIVVRYHSDVVRQASAMKLYRPVLMQFLRKADMILPTSAQYVASSPHLQAVREKCQVVPLGILPEEFEAPAPERIAAVRARYGGEYVLFSGVHRYYKGLPYLVRAAADIQAPLVIAGDGPERPAVMALAAELGVPIHFPGALSHEDLVTHLHGCAVFAFPSCERSEAFGISILEAHACGKPVVATRLGTGVEFVNLDGQTGVNVAPREPAAFAAAVNRLLLEPEIRARMGAFAKDRIAREFDARTVARREMDLYEEVAGCRQSHT